MSEPASPSVSSTPVTAPASGVTLECHTGAAIQPFIPDAARLRITVFREWPYLYEGDDEYERGYLLTYSGRGNSLFVVAKDSATGEVAGISTGIPMKDETEEVKAPFLAAGMDPESIFYFGESVLLPPWRGRGIGVRFFEERERFARSLPGIRHAVFCAVDRPAEHPFRPADYVPLDAFWGKRGFHKTTLRTQFSWKEIGEETESPKWLTFWMKEL